MSARGKKCHDEAEVSPNDRGNPTETGTNNDNLYRSVLVNTELAQLELCGLAVETCVAVDTVRLSAIDAVCSGRTIRRGLNSGRSVQNMMNSS